MSTQSADEINQQASVLMKRGIALVDANTPDCLKEAIDHFDSAIALRLTLPLDDNPLFRYGLTAGWINRGDALVRLGSGESRAEALRSYDAALETLSGLEMDTNRLFRRRVAFAWKNRGLALLQKSDALSRREAGQSYEAAIAALLEGNAAEISDRPYLLAAVRMNYANALVCEDTMDSLLRARTVAQEAIAAADQNPALDEPMAEVSLKARHILCQAITQLLSRTDPLDLSQKELIGDATDAAEEGMALARTWKHRGIERFSPLAQDLFTFAARAYRSFQPHFVNEFLLEHIEPWPEPPESRAK